MFTRISKSLKEDCSDTTIRKMGGKPSKLDSAWVILGVAIIMVIFVLGVTFLRPSHPTAVPGQAGGAGLIKDAQGH